MDRHSYRMGLIGNCSYMAYIGMNGNVDWMCWPRFDSSFIFGGLLDKEQGGYFYIRPKDPNYRSTQYYLPNTNILCTEFECVDGRFRIVDFAPRFQQYERYYKPLMLVRKVEVLDGHPLIQVGCKPVGEYGVNTPESYLGSNHIQYMGLERPLRLTTNVAKNYVLSGQPLVLDRDSYFVMTYGLPLEAPLKTTVEDFLQKTKEYWHAWVNSAAIPNMYQQEVIRSALVLKLSQFEDTGAVVAAGTTSLPEFPGEGRNWDYRFCWMRDTYYTLRSLNNLGHFEELENYAAYILNVAAMKGSRYRPVYSITGNPADMEEKITELSGYMGNQPVRIGNQAAEHIQNDVYGQVLVSLLPLFTDKRFVDKDRDLALKITWELLQKIEETIDEPDAGLWEFRNISQRHCYTFLFHWAGSNAAQKVGRYFGDDKLVEKATALSQQAANNIEACYDDEAGVYRQAIETKNLDASLFQLITMNYIDPNSERARKHLAYLEQELKAGDFLMYRYKHQDDFGKPKSTFLVCAFWYVEALASVGRIDDAIRGMESLLKYSNHLGLFSEDVEAESGSQWGNFPQSYSHVGLMNAAFMIANRINKPDFLV